MKLLFLLCAVHLLVQTGSAASEPSDSEFAVRVYTNAHGAKLPYRLLLPPQYNPQQKYPVILYLHGAAARGSDNIEPLNWGPRLFQESQLRQKHPFFLVVPQCPLDGAWLELSWGGLRSAKESPSLELALELVGKELPKEFNIDAKRRYLTGVSMGGHAVWVEMVRHPGFFAASIPVCAGGDPRIVTNEAAKFPVWAFHSDDDHLVPVQQARDLVKAWRAHGGTAKYTEYTGLRHSSWKKAYVDPDMFDWLFAQHLP
jgi:predicted peptidase